MKKISALILVITLCLSLTACAGIRNKPDFSQVMPDFDFSMTRDDAIKLENYKTPVDDFGDVLIFSSYFNNCAGKIIYRFEASGTLGSMNFTFNSDSEYRTFMNSFRETYGKADKKIRGYEFWYGVIDGVDVYFSIKEMDSHIEIGLDD